MKKEKPVRFNFKSPHVHHEINAVLESVGVVLDSPEYPDIMYYTDTVTGRKLRILESFEIQMGDENFDRWANSVCHWVSSIPETDYKLISLIQSLRILAND